MSTYQRIHDALESRGFKPSKDGFFDEWDIYEAISRMVVPHPAKPESSDSRKKAALKRENDELKMKVQEQELLLRSCRKALDVLLESKPLFGAIDFGTNTIGNLRAELYPYKNNPTK